MTSPNACGSPPPPPAPAAFLLSNSFPFSLIRRRVTVEPRTVAELLTAMHERSWVSAWGHANTLDAAGAILGADLRPACERPVLTLSAERLPQHEGRTFRECWLLSPDYHGSFRPAIGQEVACAQIRDWQVLRLAWEEPETGR